MKSRVSLKYFVIDSLWKEFLASKLPQTLSNLTALTLFINLGPLTQFQLKLEQLIFKKVLKFVLLGNYFFNFFSEVQIWC